MIERPKRNQRPTWLTNLFNPYCHILPFKLDKILYNSLYLCKTQEVGGALKTLSMLDSLTFFCLTALVADIDECSLSHGCDSSATCQNTDGSYTCSCINGYTGDGITCRGTLGAGIETFPYLIQSLKNSIPLYDRLQARWFRTLKYLEMQ